MTILTVASAARAIVVNATKRRSALAICSPACSAACTAATSPKILTNIQPAPRLLSIPSNVTDAVFAIISATAIADNNPETSSKPRECCTCFPPFLLDALFGDYRLINRQQHFHIAVRAGNHMGGSYFADVGR